NLSCIRIDKHPLAYRANFQALRDLDEQLTLRQLVFRFPIHIDRIMMMIDMLYPVILKPIGIGQPVPVNWGVILSECAMQMELGRYRALGSTVDHANLDGLRMSLQAYGLPML